MGLLMKSASVLILLLIFTNCVEANTRIIGSTVGGILALIIFILDIIAAIEILRSGKSLTEKLLWILFIVFFPIIGLVVYLICGRARSAGI